MLAAIKRAIPVLSLLAAFALLGLSVYIHLWAGRFGDKQWEMLVAKMLVDGKQLYRDIFPVSPPFIFWAYAVPAYLTRGLPSPADFDMLTGLGLLLIVGSIYVSTRLLSLHPGFAEKRNQQAEFALLLAFILIFCTIRHFFLDREHIFFLLAVPYIVRFLPGIARAPIPWALSAAAGIMAGIGFCMKPHLIVMWAGMQVLILLTSRSFRLLFTMENGLVCAIGILYVWCVWRFTPEYFSVVLPMAMATYSVVRDINPVINYATCSITILVSTFLMFRPGHATPYRRDIYYLLGMCGLFTIYILINNNWWYTYLPLESAAMLLTGFVLWEFRYLRQQYAAQQKRTRAFTLGIVACIFAIVSKMSITAGDIKFLYQDTCYNNVECLGDHVFVQIVQGNDGRPLSFGAVTMDFIRWTRLVHYSGASWVTRFPQLWMLPKFLISNADFYRDYVWILDYVADSYAKDMEKNKPDIMFVDDTESFYTVNRHVNLVAMFSIHPHFKEAFSHYRLTEAIDLCGKKPTDGSPPPLRMKCGYFVYRRIPDGTNTGGTP